MFQVDRFSRFLVVVFIATVIAGAQRYGALAGPSPNQTSAAVAASAMAPVCIDGEEQRLLDQLNAYRTANGKRALVLSQTLTAAGDYHALDMGTTGTYSHTLSDGTTWQQNIANHGYPYVNQTYLGENLAAGIDQAAIALDQWKKSSTHNANLLNRYFRTVGVSRVYVEGSDYRWYWALESGGIADGAATACGAVQPAASPSPSPSPSPAPQNGGSAYKIVGSGRTANSSSSALAYDGKSSTGWVTTSQSAPSYAYLYFDLGAAKPIRSIQWQWLESGWADRVKIQVSTNRSSWTTLATVGNAAAGGWQSLPCDVSARYVRFYFENPNRDAKLGMLGEVQILA